MRILMVFLGNICRSPIAEGLMRDKIRKNGLDWTVGSAGTNSYHTGDAPHKFSQKVCQANGVDISGQRARTFVAADFSKYDKIYAFADDVYQEIKKIGGKNADMGKVDYFLNELDGAPNQSVPDPWYGNEEGYTPVYQLIDKTCDEIIKKYK
jgi:protein-tyrosine phosphatase